MKKQKIKGKGNAFHRLVFTRDGVGVEIVSGVAWRLVFTSDGVAVAVVSGVARGLMILWKSKIAVVSGVISTRQNWSYKNHFLSSSENQIVGVGNRGGRINQFQGTFPRFVIGLDLPLLLATPTTQVSRDRKRQPRKRNQYAVFPRT